MQLKIKNRLSSLKELEGVQVKVSGVNGGTIRIRNAKHHAPEFIFRWNTDHFIGYFLDGDDNESQAVVSLYTPMDAIKFIGAYSILNELRANQKAA